MLKLVEMGLTDSLRGILLPFGGQGVVLCSGQY